MQFKLRQMEVFRAVMMTGTVSGAARMLYVSQPAVSRLLAHTESSLGITLFDRVSGKLVPTHAATILFDEVQRVYDAALKVDRVVENLSASATSDISLSSSPSLGLSLMPKVIERYQQQNPKARIHFHTTMIQDVPMELLSGRIDLAVTVVPLEHPSLLIETLTRGNMVCILPERHPLVAKPAISFEDLSRHKTIFYSQSIPFGRLTHAALEAHGFDIKPSIDVPRAELACALVRRNLGVAIMDEFSVADNPWTGIVVRPLVEQIQFNVSTVCLKFNMRSAPTETFIDHLRQVVQESRAG